MLFHLNFAAVTFIVFQCFHSTVVASTLTDRIKGNCSRSQVQIIKDAARHTLGDIKGLQVAVDQALNTGDHTARVTQNLTVARRRLRCMSGKVSHTRYVCKRNEAHSCDDSQAFVGGGVASVVTLDIVVPAKISLCWNFFGQEPLTQRATLVHETAHMCEADDSAYFGPVDNGYPHAPVPADTWSTKAARVADTYGYWIKYGFCIPGETCVTKETKKMNDVISAAAAP